MHETVIFTANQVINTSYLHFYKILFNVCIYFIQYISCSTYVFSDNAQDVFFSFLRILFISCDGDDILSLRISLRELNLDPEIQADLGDNLSFLADDLGVEFGFHSHLNLVVAKSLNERVQC